MEKKIQKLVVFMNFKDILLSCFEKSTFIKMLENQGYNTTYIKSQEIDPNYSNCIFADIKNKTVRFANVNEYEEEFGSIDFIGKELIEKKEEFYNCGTNKSLFLSLAMRSNGTDANQWFIDQKSGIKIFNPHHDFRGSFSVIYSLSLHDREIQDYDFRKMTDEEIIDGFKYNEIINQGEPYFYNTKLVDKELILFKLLSNKSKLVKYDINDDYLCVNDGIVYSMPHINTYSAKTLTYYDQFVSVAKINPFYHKNQLFKVLHKTVNVFGLDEKVRMSLSKGNMIEMKFDYCLVEGMIPVNLDEITEYYDMPF